MSLHKAVEEHNLEVFCETLSQISVEAWYSGLSSVTPCVTEDNSTKEDVSDNPPLHTAVLRKNKETVQLLLEAKADVSLKNKSGYTALQCALNARDFDFSKMLMDAGSDVDSLDESGQTALQLICRRVRDIPNNEQVAWVDYLLTLGADIHRKDSQSFTALHYATLHGNLKIMKILIDAGANVNCKNSQGLTALHLAAFSNNLPVIEHLLFRGANADVVDDNGQTPLHKACSPLHYNMEAIKLLMENTTNVNNPDNENRTPLIIILWHILRGNEFAEEWKIILKFLLQYSDVNIEDFEGNTVLNIIKKQRYVYGGNSEDLRKEMCSKTVLEHLAKLHALNLPIHENILKNIDSDYVYKSYFKKCQEELARAKETKLRNSWITYFNLLIHERIKLKNYAGNEDLIDDFTTSDCLTKFPIYGASMKEIVEKGIKVRELFDTSSELLSDHWPIFGPSHLVIRGILDCLTQKDLNKFCEQ